MKVKIGKYAEGGPFFRATFLSSPFTSGAPATTKTSNSTSSTTEEKTLGEKDIFKTLLEKNGLTNDVYRLINDLAGQDINSITSSGGTSKVLSLIGKVNEIVNNRKMWDESVTVAKSNGAFEEVAIGSSGQLFYKDAEGKLGNISAEEYRKNAKKYGTLLSVGDLLIERQNNQNLAYDTKVFSIAQNSVGIDKVREDIIKLLGTLSTYTDLKERTYTKEDLNHKYEMERNLINQAGRKPTAQEEQGLNILAELVSTPGEYVKYEEKESGKGKDVAAAYNYILGSLSDKERMKLDVTAKLSGTTGVEVLKGMLYNATAKSYESKITPTKGSEITDKENTEGLKSLTTYQLFHKDKLKNDDMVFTFNDPKLQVLFKGTIGSVAPLLTPKGEALPMITLGGALSSGINQLVKSDNIYFGEKKVPMEAANNIVYDGGDVAKVYMPVGMDGSPDFRSLQDFKELYATFEAYKDTWSTKEASDFFKDHGFRIQIDEKYEDGKKVKFVKDNEYVKPFLVMYGYTNDATGLTEDNNNYITKLTGDEQDAVLPLLKQVWTVGTGKNAKDYTPDKSFHTEKYYKGIITIPYRKEHAAIVDAQVGQGAKEKVPSISDVQLNLRNSVQSPMGSFDANKLINK